MVQFVKGLGPSKSINADYSCKICQIGFEMVQSNDY